MKIVVLLSAMLAICGCTTAGLVRVSTIPSVADGVHLRTAVADIEMNYSDVEAAIRASNPSHRNQDSYLRELRGANTRVFVANLPSDKVAAILVWHVAPELLRQGRAVVVDIHSSSVAPYIRVGNVHGSPGESGIYFCLPDGREFLRRSLMIE